MGEHTRIAEYEGNHPESKEIHIVSWEHGVGSWWSHFFTLDQMRHFDVDKTPPGHYVYIIYDGDALDNLKNIALAPLPQDIQEHLLNERSHSRKQLDLPNEPRDYDNPDQLAAYRAALRQHFSC